MATTTEDIGKLDYVIRVETTEDANGKPDTHCVQLVARVQTASGSHEGVAWAGPSQPVAEPLDPYASVLDHLNVAPAAG